MPYAHAPIAEAIIDLRVEVPQELTFAAFGRLPHAMEGAYTKQGERYEGQFSFGKEVPPTAKRTVTGYVYRNADGKQVMQAHLKGFTFSRLAPYDRWEPFRDEARRLWNIYRSAALPKSITRVAVRYINRLDIPLPIRDFRDYLRTFPEVSTDLPQALSGFLLQLQVPQEDGSMLVINQALVPPRRPETVSVVLDIDVSRQEDLPQNEEDLWAGLEKLRCAKNEAFEACITRQTRRLIS